MVEGQGTRTKSGTRQFAESGSNTTFSPPPTIFSKRKLSHRHHVCSTFFHSPSLFPSTSLVLLDSLLPPVLLPLLPQLNLSLSFLLLPLPSSLRYRFVLLSLSLLSSPAGLNSSSLFLQPPTRVSSHPHRPSPRRNTPSSSNREPKPSRRETTRRQRDVTKKLSRSRGTAPSSSTRESWSTA